MKLEELLDLVPMEENIRVVDTNDPDESVLYTGTVEDATFDEMWGLMSGMVVMQVQALTDMIAPAMEIEVR